MQTHIGSPRKMLRLAGLLLALAALACFPSANWKVAPPPPAPSMSTEEGRALAALLGRGSVATTAIYAQPSETDLVEIVEELT